MREGIDYDALNSGKAVKLRLPPGYKTRFQTDSGKIKIVQSPGTGTAASIYPGFRRDIPLSTHDGPQPILSEQLFS